MNIISCSEAENKGVAQIPAEKQRGHQDALFAHGIVITATGGDEWGFAVSR